MFKKISILICCFVILGFVAGCGVSGSLYRDDASQTKQAE